MLADTLVRMGLERAGASYGNRARRREYLLHQYPGDVGPNGEPTWTADNLGKSQSGCLLTLRGLLAHQRRADGSPELDGRTPWGGREVDLLRCTYGQPFTGHIEGMLQTFARHRGLLDEQLYRGADAPQLRPGDFVIIGSRGSAPTDSVQADLWRRDWGGSIHGFLVTGIEGTTVHSVDGGQTDIENHGAPTAIKPCKRELVRQVNGWWLRSADGRQRRLNWRLRAGELPLR